MSIFVVATPFRHRGPNICRISSYHRSFDTLSRCRCPEAKKLLRAQLRFFVLQKCLFNPLLPLCSPERIWRWEKARNRLLFSDRQSPKRPETGVPSCCRQISERTKARLLSCGKQSSKGARTGLLPYGR